jgi:Vps4 C terminal oligomerisation domain
MRALCTKAAKSGRISVVGGSIADLSEEEAACISYENFVNALDAVAPSVSGKDLLRYVDWNTSFGSYRKVE